MVNNLPAFAPSLVPIFPEVAGLRVYVNQGTVNINNVTIFVPSTFVTVAANTTTYIFLNLTTGTINSTTTGFSAPTDYPIAIAITTSNLCSTLIDARPDVFDQPSSGGGGGGVADTVEQVSANTSLTMPTSGNLVVEATAGAGGITLTLPSAIGISGRTISIIQVDTGVGGVSIATSASQTINGYSSMQLTNQWQTYGLESDNANWIIVASFG